MKTVCLHIILLMLFCDHLTAQITLKEAPKIWNVGCEHSSLGSIEVNVVQTHPPYSYLWSTGQTGHEVINLEPGIYTLKIEDATGTDTLLQFTIIQAECELSPQIFFTPNDDGINDTWGISNGIFFSNALILVYNRLGQKVFEFSGTYTSTEQWDGKDILGVPLPTSTYFFIVFPDKSDRKKFKKGTVSIVR